MRNVKKICVFAAVAGLSLGMATAGMAHDKGDILVRAGVVTVVPSGDSGAVSGLPDGVNNAGVDVENDTQLSVTGVYMLWDKIGLELLAATPFTHDIVGEGDLSGVNVGEASHLPPTLSLQYYFDTRGSRFQPYLGLGLNYTMFFSEEVDGSLLKTLNTLPTISKLGGVKSVDMELDDSIGLAAQAGMDVQLKDDWYLNAAVWYVDIDTTATLRTDLGTSHEVDVDIDPWVFNVALAYKF